MIQMEKNHEKSRNRTKGEQKKVVNSTKCLNMKTTSFSIKKGREAKYIKKNYKLLKYKKTDVWFMERGKKNSERVRCWKTWAEKKDLNSVGISIPTIKTLLSVPHCISSQVLLTLTVCFVDICVMQTYLTTFKVSNNKSLSTAWKKV